MMMKIMINSFADLSCANFPLSEIGALIKPILNTECTSTSEQCYALGESYNTLFIFITLKFNNCSTKNTIPHNTQSFTHLEKVPFSDSFHLKLSIYVCIYFGKKENKNKRGIENFCRRFRLEIIIIVF